jgi:hypothetical protein
MGKFHNAEVFRQFKPLDTAPEAWEEPEPVVLTDYEADQEASDAYWTKLDAAPRRVTLPDEMYAPGVRHVRLPGDR